jgi:TolA-binding protein
MTSNRPGRSAIRHACGVVTLLVAFALPAAAQYANVSSTDIQRLQDQVYQASSDISRLRSTNPDLAGSLQTDLDDIRDEVAYLKVKQRKEGNVSRNDYSDVENRLQELRARAHGDARSDSRGDGRNTSQSPTWRTNSDGTATTNGGVRGGVTDQGSSGPRGTNTSVIPSGQELDLRLEAELSSATAQVEQRFQATTVADLYRGNEVLIPAGSVVRGVVSSVTKATRMERKGSMTIAFDQVTVRGRTYPMRGTVTQALESEGIRGEAGRIGTGAGVGAIIGGIIGGIKGAVLGVLIGGGGTVAATEGKDVTLPAGTILRVRLDTPPDIR